jgi:hypothetical protein
MTTNDEAMEIKEATTEARAATEATTAALETRMVPAMDFLTSRNPS